MRFKVLAAAATAAALVSLGVVVTLPSAGAQTNAQAAVPAKDWLHTSGNKIVDANGNEVWLTGTNWFGFNATERVFHGLWSGNITEITKSMADRGINLVRVPISTQLLLEWKNGQAAVPSGVNTYANPELVGKTSLGVFDYFLQLCEQFGIKVMLDVHSAEADNSGHLYPVWWKGSITTENFYQGWEYIAQRYKNNDTLIAADIKNEPHGKWSESPRAKWDNSTDQDNFKNTCQTAGSRILAINPDMLIMCEGIEIFPKNGTNWSSTSEADYYGDWWGGNLRGVAQYPVNLGNHIVYSPHDYGPLVYEQPWFQKPFDKTSLTQDVWGPNWLYIHQNNIAPLLVGEWGGRLGQDARQDKWMLALRDLIAETRISQTFWVLNPNSGDTGGLLLDDWKTWDEAKYAMLKPALWQYSGKFVGLDHQVRLGANGMSLADRYGGTVNPSDSASPSKSPSASPSPSKSPSTSPSVSTPPPSGKIRVQYKNNSPATNDQEIKPGLQVVNAGSAALALNTVTVRYYFTRDNASYSIWCDWAQIGCGNLATRVVNLPAAVNGADAYIEVGFTGGSLAPGANTGEMQLRVSRTDWQPVNESNDYSRGTATSYVDAATVPGYVGGSLAWGVQP
ncbi:cellulase family glycosylhydrolase [Dactylosporangium sp. CS-033363]|uniref:cellulase family glycosylhydrolase n=1 Tax=Dactylosporangium sp. CS-033363 TaxID=3239935 RepID=UPI003D92A457